VVEEISFNLSEESKSEIYVKDRKPYLGFILPKGDAMDVLQDYSQNIS